MTPAEPPLVDNIRGLGLGQLESELLAHLHLHGAASQTVLRAVSGRSAGRVSTAVARLVGDGLVFQVYGKPGCVVPVPFDEALPALLTRRERETARETARLKGVGAALGVGKPLDSAAEIAVPPRDVPVAGVRHLLPPDDLFHEAAATLRRARRSRDLVIPAQGTWSAAPYARRLMASHRRGIAVRVLITRVTPRWEEWAGALGAGGVAVRVTSARGQAFQIIDGMRAELTVMYRGCSRSVFTEDPDDLASLVRLFRAAWDDAVP